MQPTNYWKLLDKFYENIKQCTSINDLKEGMWLQTFIFHLSFHLHFVYSATHNLNNNFKFTPEFHAQALSFELFVFSSFSFCILCLCWKMHLWCNKGGEDLLTIIMPILLFIASLKSLIHELLMFHGLSPFMFHLRHLSPLIEPLAFYLHLFLNFCFKAWALKLHKWGNIFRSKMCIVPTMEL